MTERHEYHGYITELIDESVYIMMGLPGKIPDEEWILWRKNFAPSLRDNLQAGMRVRILEEVEVIELPPLTDADLATAREEGKRLYDLFNSPAKGGDAE